MQKWFFASPWAAEATICRLGGWQRPEVSQKLSPLLFPDQGRQNMLVMCATGIDSSDVYDKAGGFSAAQTSIGGYEKNVNFNAMELQLPQNLMFSRALDLKFPGIPALNLWWI